MTMPAPNRRAFLGGAAAAAAASLGVPAWSRTISHGASAKGFGSLAGPDIALRVAHSAFTVDGRKGHAITLNAMLPAPLLRFREGDRVRIAVTNALDEDTSIHWHGLLVPFHMDGVPGVSFPGIAPRSTFVYEFDLRQAGTYWYHSHSGLQEQSGHYGPLVIDPAGDDPVAFDREHIVLLSDWSAIHAHEIFRRLKADAGQFNRQKRTLADRLSGRPDPLSASDQAMFARMRMDPTDIADVTGDAYTYLINGHSTAENWTGLFRAGERVRLRIINAAAQSIFNVRIPGMAMTVVAADGIAVRPVEVDEFQIGNAETYDVIVRPEDRPYALVAESIDRSGMAVATLAPRAGQRAAVPPLRARPTLTMRDMGMDHGAGHGTDHGAGHDMAHGAPPAGHRSMDMRDKGKADFPVGVGVDMIAPMPVDRNADPGVGLDGLAHRVLTYADLRSLTPRAGVAPPTRRIDIHLTGNMERFMWSMDGEKLSENPEPYRLALGERVRMRLINDTMMTHPMHIHGHYWELVTPDGLHQPLKHTVRVLPGAYVDLDMTADAPGDWAFHCHMLYHMHAGMMRVVTVRPMGAGA